MKKTIMILTLIAITTLTFAQAKTDTVKRKAESEKPKVEYRADPKKVYQFNLNLTAQEVSILTAGPEEWKTIIRSPQMSGEQIGQVEDRADELRRNLKQLLAEQMKADYEKFKADTAATNKTLIKK